MHAIPIELIWDQDRAARSRVNIEAEVLVITEREGRIVAHPLPTDELPRERKAPGKGTGVVLIEDGRIEALIDPGARAQLANKRGWGSRVGLAGEAKAQQLWRVLVEASCHNLARVRLEHVPSLGSSTRIL